MEVVHISQFYNCSEISVCSELYYVCELGKNLLMRGNKSLSLNGVVLSDTLRSSRYWDFFRIAVKSGWVINANVNDLSFDISIQSPVDDSKFNNIFLVEEEYAYDAEDASKRRLDLMYDIMTPKKAHVEFAKRDADKWYFEFSKPSPSGAYSSSKDLNGKFSSQSWVSICAYVAVNRFLHGVPETFFLELGDSVVASKQLPTADILLLYQETDALKGWVNLFLNVNEHLNLQCGYQSWWFSKYESGLARREYAAKEKYEYASRLGIKTGDVVMLYERCIEQRFNYIKTISGARMAVVTSISKRGITLNTISNRKSKYSYQQIYDNFTDETKALYCNNSESLGKLRSATIYKDWIDLGVDGMLWSETEFITLLQGDDIQTLSIELEGQPVEIVLNEYDTIYWVLKDYDIDFDDERFVKLYYKNDIPAYEKYKQNMPMSQYIITK